jgi:transcriptional regulator with XRE-family HTH domain
MDITRTNGYRCFMRRTEGHTKTKDRPLAAILRDTREGRGETQEDVAHRAGLTIAAYARIERGTADPKWTTVRSISDALEINLGRLDSTAQLESL